MDRELSNTTVRKRRLKPLLTIGAGFLVLLLSLFVFRSFLKTSIDRLDIRLATAEIGTIENTLTASGEIIPEFEQVISCPINADIEAVLLRPGAAIQPGEPILQLGLATAILQYEKINDQLELKKNAIVQLNRQLKKEQFDLEINNDIKGLTISNLEAELEDQKRLQKIGGATQEDIEKAELNLKIARLEKKQLANELAYKNESMTSLLREHQLEASIQEKELREIKRKLNLAAVVAKRSGVVTWVNENIGTSVKEGEALARVADLASFRVEGSISDVYAERLRPGQSTIIRINENELRGKILRIKPTIENSIVRFIIQLEEDNHELLRPNMKVEVYVITAAQNQTVRVQNGPAFKGKAKQYVFVVDGDVAYRREVNIGLSNFDFVEIQNRIQAGEQIIISDMSDYEHLEKVQLK